MWCYQLLAARRHGKSLPDMVKTCFKDSNTSQIVQSRNKRLVARAGAVPHIIRYQSACRLVSGITCLILVGCAGKARYPVGEALLRGEASAAEKAVDSLRAKVELTGFQGGVRSSVSAALSARPGKDYKLDVFGLPGMVEAAFLWQDTGWTLVIYGREGYFRGYGDTVDLPGLGIREARVHDLFGFLWGDFFPGDAGRAAPGGAVVGDGMQYAGADGMAWTARLDRKTGVVLEVVRADSGVRVEYGNYKVMEGRAVPGKVLIRNREKPVLEIAVDDVEDNPAWKKSPFRIKVPKGFEELRRARKL